MKVFISSVIQGYEEYRKAVASAVSLADHEVIRAEGLTSQSITPQQTCLGAVRESDIVILLLGSDYGAVQSSGLSATQEEYNEAVGEQKQILAFVEEVENWDPKQEEFVKEIEDWSTGLFRNSFRSVDDLRNKVIKSLFNLARAESLDIDELSSYAKSILPIGWENSSKWPMLFVAVAAGPRHEVIRPSQLESQQIITAIQQMAMFGQNAVFDQYANTSSSIARECLVLEQDQSAITIDEYGTVLITQPAVRSSNDPGFNYPMIIEEDIQKSIARSLYFIGEVLDVVDELHRLSHLAPLVALSNGNFTAWRTEAEHRANPDSFTPINIRPCVIEPNTPLLLRTALFAKAEELAEDICIRLRRRAVVSSLG